MQNFFRKIFNYGKSDKKSRKKKDRKKDKKGAIEKRKRFEFSLLHLFSIVEVADL